MLPPRVGPSAMGWIVPVQGTVDGEDVWKPRGCGDREVGVRFRCGKQPGLGLTSISAPRIRPTTGKEIETQHQSTDPTKEQT